MQLTNQFNTEALYRRKLGEYSLAADANPGAGALTTNSEIFQFRWSNTKGMAAAVKRVTLSAVYQGTAFVGAPAYVTVEALRVSGWSAAGGGGAALDVSTGTNKRMSSMPSSQIPSGDIRICSGSVLTAGTKTIEATPFASLSFPIAAATTGGQIIPQTKIVDFDPTSSEFPETFLVNEGFILRTKAIPGTGTILLSVAINWAEVDKI